MNKVFIALLCVILLVYSAFLIFMLLWGLITSLKSNADFLYNNNVIGLPNLEKSRNEFLRLANYKLILQNFEFTRKTSFYFGNRLVKKESVNNIWTLLFNTVWYAGLGSVLLAIVPAVTAFLCVKFKRFKMSKVIYGANLVCMTLPLVGTAPATVELLRGIGLYDTVFAHIFQKFSFGGMYFLVFYAFYNDLPDAYQEAAEIDGASYYGILVRIILPLSAKMLTTVILLQFVALWNDYQTTLLYFPTHPTLAYGVYYMGSASLDAKLSKVPARVAACMFLAVPVFVIFLVARNKLMGNISIGGVKE